MNRFSPPQNNGNEITLWVCIPVFNRLQYTRRCLECLSHQSYPNYRIVVCDDGSTDGTARYLQTHFPSVKVLHGDGNLWWTRSINRCIEYALQHCDSHDAVITLNNDLEVDQDYLTHFLRVHQRYPNAIIGSAIYDLRSGRLVDPGHRHSWVTAKSRLVDPLRDMLTSDERTAEVTHLPGRGTLIPVKVFHRIGLFDSKHLPHYGADFDFTFRAGRRGYRILVSHEVQVASHVDATGMTEVRKELTWSSFKRYLTDIKSPANVPARFWLAMNNCPRWLLPSALTLDLAFVVGSFFKFHALRRARRLLSG